MGGRIWIQCDTKEWRIGMGPWQDLAEGRYSDPQLRAAWEAAGRCPVRFQGDGMTCDVVLEGPLAKAVPVEGFKSNSEFRKCMRAHFWKIAGIKLGDKNHK